MTKKMLLVLVLVFSVFSIILIAVWGTLPDNASNIQAEQLVIDDYDEKNETNDKFKNITDIVTEQDNIYAIVYRYDPTDANVNIIASTTATGINLQIDPEENKVYVLFSLEAISQRQMVTVQIKDNFTQIYDEITLWFKDPGIIVVPDI